MTDGNTDVKPELNVFLYMDDRALLDLVAIIEDGLALERKSTFVESTETAKDGSLAAKAVARFWPIAGLSAEGGWGKRRKEGASGETELVTNHTLGSLFEHLRRELVDRGQLKDLSKGSDPPPDLGPSDFVVFSGVFQVNPFLSAMRNMKRFLDLIGTFPAGYLATENQDQHAHKNPQKSKGSMKVSTPQKEQQQLHRVLESMTEDFERTGMVDVLVTCTQPSGWRTVVPLLTQKLRDPSFSELLEGEYRVLGKVAKVARRGEEIDLMKRSALGFFNPDFLKSMFEGLSPDKMGPVKMEQPIPAVQGPAMMVIPIAVYC